MFLGVGLLAGTTDESGRSFFSVGWIIYKLAEPIGNHLLRIKYVIVYPDSNLFKFEVEEF